LLENDDGDVEVFLFAFFWFFVSLGGFQAVEGVFFLEKRGVLLGNEGGGGWSWGGTWGMVMVL